MLNSDADVKKKKKTGRHQCEPNVKRAKRTDLAVSFSAVVPPPPEWFLSPSGQDTTECGGTLTSACRTLDWVLTRYNTTRQSRGRTLSLRTTSGVDVTPDIVVRMTVVC